MICPRCDSGTVEVMSKSPVGDVWEAYICTTCWYSWRSTETPDRTDPKQYKAVFKIKPENISKMVSLMPLPKPK